MISMQAVGYASREWRESEVSLVHLAGNDDLMNLMHETKRMVAIVTIRDVKPEVIEPQGGGGV
jgi:hypothetical protein